jgi:hypothetical protein
MSSVPVKITPAMIELAQELEGATTWKFYSLLGEMALADYLKREGKKFTHTVRFDRRTSIGCPLILLRNDGRFARVKVVTNSGPWQRNMIVGEARFLRDMADFYVAVCLDMERYYAHIRGHITAPDLFENAGREMSKGVPTFTIPLADLLPVELMLEDVKNDPQTSPAVDRNEGRPVSSEQNHGPESVGVL